MAGLDSKILEEFLTESKILIDKMNETLLKCEGDFSQVKSLETYGMNADRIMGGAKSLALASGSPSHPLHKIGDYAGICKLVGYKAALIADNQAFYNICVALLLDGTEVLWAMLTGLRTGRMEIKKLVSSTFIDRLRWVSQQFGQEYSSKVDIHKGRDTKLNQSDIDDLLKKIGF